MEGAGAHFHVIGLQNDAAPVGPIALQRQNEPLERPLRPHMERQIFVRRLRHQAPFLVKAAARSSRWLTLGSQSRRDSRFLIPDRGLAGSNGGSRWAKFAISWSPRRRWRWSRLSLPALLARHRRRIIP